MPLVMREEWTILQTSGFSSGTEPLYLIELIHSYSMQVKDNTDNPYIACYMPCGLSVCCSYSEYIMPEDVWRFASLCQATLYITTTARFWLTMHRR